MFNFLFLASFTILALTPATSFSGDYTKPDERQALYFDTELSGKNLILTSQLDSSVNKLNLSLDYSIDDDLLAPTPTTITVSPTSGAENDILSLLLPSYGFEYHGETHRSDAQFSVEVHSPKLGGDESVVRMLLFTEEPDPVATLIINQAINEAILIENRPYAMGRFLIELIDSSKHTSQQTHLCLQRTFNGSYICKNPTFTETSQ